MELRRLPRLLSMASAASVLACGSDGPAGIPARSLEIEVITSGDETDSDGYTLQIDAEPSRTVGASGVLQDNDITAGDHSVYLGGVAANCSVDGANPRTVTVPTEGRARLIITVVCSARLGSIGVGVRTHGPTTYPSTYTIALNGVEAARVDTGRVLLERVPPGQHVVELGGVPLHCMVNGNRWTITVRPAEVASVEFFVECVGLHGTLVITTLAFGDQSPSSFVYTVDGKNPTRIGPVAIHALPVSAGNHTVELLDIPSRCRVESPNPSVVGVPATATGRVRFRINCEASGP